MIQIFFVLWPETLLVVVACALLLLGVAQSAIVRRIIPVAAFCTLAIVFIGLFLSGSEQSRSGTHDYWNTLFVYHFQEYVRLIAAGGGMLLALLAWPTNADCTGNSALQFGHEAGEFFGLMLLSIAGIFFVASANDIILLFLGIELASFPTYVMVSISRPLPVAQEAGVKYFFLGAMAAATMLFGFSYLYGTTGATNLGQIGYAMHLAEPGHAWQLMAVVLVLLGLAFKIAAVPLHAYAGDVYEGAATPVTAFLAFVPKTSGFVAIIKVLFYVSNSGGTPWVFPDTIAKLLWIMAVLTMFFGNVLALLQSNIKRLLAYSSVAHSGYMLVGLTALVSATGQPDVQRAALGGVLFYLAAYGIMNTGAFGVLMMLPSRDLGFRGILEPSESQPLKPMPTGTSAETFDDIAGTGRRHVWLGLAMAICCWSLTGLPFTVGFFGKVFLIKPALALAASDELRSRMAWLVVLTMVNAAISAAYYLKIIAAMFLRPEPRPLLAPIGAQRSPQPALAMSGQQSWPIVGGIALSVIGTLAFGILFPAVNALSDRVQSAQIEPTTSTAPSSQHVVTMDSPR